MTSKTGSAKPQRLETPLHARRRIEHTFEVCAPLFVGSQLNFCERDTTRQEVIASTQHASWPIKTGRNHALGYLFFFLSTIQLCVLLLSDPSSFFPSFFTHFQLNQLGKNLKKKNPPLYSLQKFAALLENASSSPTSTSSSSVRRDAS